LTLRKFEYTLYFPKKVLKLDSKNDMIKCNR